MHPHFRPVPVPAPVIATLLLGNLAGVLSGQDDPSLQATLQTTVRPFVQQWCGACHGKQEPEADLHLLRHFSKLATGEDLAIVLDVRDVLKAGAMPPEGEPQPPAAAAAEVIAWAERMLAAARTDIGPGRVTMRRLSRVEYRNTVRDLLELPEEFLDGVVKGFPADDLGYGFDNNGDTLSVSVLHVENYATAARRIAEHAIQVENHANPPRRLFELEDYVPGDKRVRAHSGGAYFTSRGVVELPVELPRRGLYRIQLRAYGDQAGPEVAKLGVDVDGKRVAGFEVAPTKRKPGTFSQELTLDGGQRRFGVSFTNDFFDAKAHKKGKRRGIDRNLWVDYLEVIGPLDAKLPGPAHQRIFAADPAGQSAGRRAGQSSGRPAGQSSGRPAGNRSPRRPAQRARPMLRDLVQRAWRRPVRSAELTRLCRLVQQACDAGDAFEEGMQLALQAVLVSPNFLFRMEPQGHSAADPSRVEAPSRSKPTATERLGHYEIAARLSYFLWSSMPDAPLSTLARGKRLQDPEVLAGEVHRMLDDPRAVALAQNFAVQWLELRSLDEATPDPERYPTFAPVLRDAMRRESELFFHAVQVERRSVLELLDADFTYLNEVLAAHYGIAGVVGPQMRRVALSDRRRGGVVTHASVQTVTSNPTRTSPVKRGKWLLENILDAPPPPPPPGFDAFPEGADVNGAASLRAQMAQHQKSPMCASCHRRMDALGLALENYDAIGRWREADRGAKIDASGELPGGEKIDGALGLKQVLARGDAFKRCLAKKLFTYGLGRNVRGRDEVVIDAMVRALPAQPTLEDMIQAIVRLDAFRSRRLR